MKTFDCDNQGCIPEKQYHFSFEGNYPIFFIQKSIWSLIMHVFIYDLILHDRVVSTEIILNIEGKVFKLWYFFLIWNNSKQPSWLI